MHKLLKKLTCDTEEDSGIDISAILEDSLESSDIHLQKTVWINGAPQQRMKTLEDINREVFAVIQRCAPPHQHKDLCDKLVGYRVVHELPELHKSKAVKILRHKETSNEVRLQQMGVVLNIKFYDNGTHVVCRMPPRSVIQFKYNEALAVFQKLSDDESMLLYLDNNIKN